MEILSTTRLTLRTWNLNDVPRAHSIWGDPEVMKYVDGGKPLSAEDIKRAIEAGIRHQTAFGFQHWAVIDNQSQNLVGSCGFNKSEGLNQIEMVFHFSKPSWGRGFATEAAKGCIDFALAKIHPNKIIAGCHPENKASMRVLEKVGFQFVGNKWFEDTQREEPYFEIPTKS